MKVREMMTKRPVTVRPGDTFRKAVQIMASRNISGCPVVENRRLVGTITQTDIIRAVDVYGKINKDSDVFALLVSMLKSGSDTARLRKLLRSKVREIMSNGAVSVNLDRDIYEAARLMNKHDVDQLHVVKNEELVGILTKKDIMRFLEKVG